MSDEILDAPNSIKTHPYIPWWRAGLYGGAISSIVYYLILLLFGIRNEPYKNELTALVVKILTNVLMYLPIIFWATKISIKAERKYAYLKILGCIAVSLLISMIVNPCMLLLAMRVSLEEFSINIMPFLSTSIQQHATKDLPFAIILAFALWLIPRKLPYFRKSVEH